jgi:hypothetical protein
MRRAGVRILLANPRAAQFRERSGNRHAGDWRTEASISGPGVRSMEMRVGRTSANTLCGGGVDQREDALPNLKLITRRVEGNRIP